MSVPTSIPNNGANGAIYHGGEKVQTTLKRSQIVKWVEILRSGTRKQTKGHLCDRRDGELAYCCLGVYATDIEGLQPEWVGTVNVATFKFPVPLEHRDIATHSQLYLSRGNLPGWDALSVLGENLWLASGSTATISPIAHCIFMNDDGKTFKQIADFVEAAILDNPRITWALEVDGE